MGPESGALGALGNVGYADDYLTGTSALTLTWEPTITLGSGSTITGTLALTSGTLSLTYDYPPAAIPEPSTIAVLAGLAALGSVAARRSRQAAAQI